MIRALVILLALAAASLEAQSGRRQDVIDPNVASEKELLALPHATAPIAKAILDGRPFATRSWDETIPRRLC